MATNGNANHHDPYAAPAQTTEAPANADSAALQKDQVGWYFVEQYYTTMSKSPESLHLYYGKKAQFVCGREAQVVGVSFGRQAIQERIKSMDFLDCKVRISNVDTQGSEDNLVIQVIGEMATREDGEPKKFVQTFVLAPQPSGYFVLNDMLRFIKEDAEEELVATPAEESATEAPVAVESETKTELPVAEEAGEKQESAPLDTAAVTEKLEEAADETPAAAEAPAAEPAAGETNDATATGEPQTAADVEQTVEEIAEEEVKKPEEPKDPNPTPAVAPAPVRAPAAALEAAQPEKPKEPPKPMSWASRVAAAAGAPRAPVPVPKTTTPPAPAQPRAPAPAAPQPAAPATPVAQQAESVPAPVAPKDQGNEWQTAETKRQSRAQPPSAAPVEREGTMAYIKYVTEKVKDEDLRAALTKFGELAYFDINRQKNCAFVEFKTQAGYNAAVAANPHTVNGENIVVEQRRPKANAYGGANYNAARGGASGRGRGGYEPSRSGSQSGRGGFTGQPRGRGGGPRGRGASQVGAA